MARPATALLIASALALASAPASLAAGGPGFAIDAKGFESYFRYEVAPGALKRGAVRVVNRTERPTTVFVRTADVTTAAGGGLQYGTETAQANGRWVRLARSRVRLAAGAVETVRFRLRVPDGAEPGDHFAGIVALNRADVRAARRRQDDGRGLALRFLPRLAIAVQATVPGGRTRELTTGQAGIDVAPTATGATLAVRNSGELLVGATSGDLAILQGDTVLARRYLDLGAFVPRTEIRLRVPFEGTPAEGMYRLRGTLRPEGAEPIQVDEEVEFGAEAATQFRRETGREAQASGISPLIVAIGGAAAMLAILALAARVRSLSRMEPAGFEPAASALQTRRSTN
jgi:Bacterial protein of unknown function (DUF916)